MRPLLLLFLLIIYSSSANAREEDAYNLKTLEEGASKKIFRNISILPITGWGGISFPGSEQRDDESNIIIEGAFEQGVDLYDLPKNAHITVFTNLNYTKDTKGFGYNNKVKLGLGVKIRYSAFDNISFNTGLKYEIDRRIKTSENLKGLMFFTDWYAGWSLDAFMKDKYPSLTFPGYTWGGVRYPGSQANDEEDLIILEGSIGQSVDWYKIHNSTVNSFIEFDYVMDTEGYEWVKG